MNARPPGLSALDRFLDPLGRELTVEAARSILGIRIDQETQDLVATLAEKCNEGLLTDEEMTEYRELIEGAEILALLKLKAREAIASRGVD